MEMASYLETLDRLIRKYRDVPFFVWDEMYRGIVDRFNDYASDDTSIPGWWQAHTDVLEIVTDGDGRRWAHVSVVVYPDGVHSSPPAPAAGLAVYTDGTVEGAWSNEEAFTYRQVGKGAV